jgi:sugar phosphate isomerase/epimerase
MTTLSRRDFLATAAGAAAVGLLPQIAAAQSPRKFQLGLVTYNVAKDWDLPTILKICKETGIAAIECRTTHKHGVEPTLSPDQRKDVKKQFADSGVVFWGCGSTCEFHAADPAVVKKYIEDCKRFIALVKDLGGKGVKVRPNGVPKGGDLQKTLAQIGGALIECGKAAGDAGVEIWVEVHGAITQEPKNMRSIMDACGHPAVGVCWNSNAADLDANKSAAASFELLKPFLRSCHINDLENDKNGKYPYRELFKLLRGAGYDRYTMIEYGKSFDPASGTAFLKGYKKLWEELANG